MAEKPQKADYCNIPACPEKYRKSVDGKEVRCVDYDRPTHCAVYRMWLKKGDSIYQYGEQKNDYF